MTFSVLFFFFPSHRGRGLLSSWECNCETEVRKKSCTKRATNTFTCKFIYLEIARGRDFYNFFVVPLRREYRPPPFILYRQSMDNGFSPALHPGWCTSIAHITQQVQPSPPVTPNSHAQASESWPQHSTFRKHSTFRRISTTIVFNNYLVRKHSTVRKISTTS